MAGKRKYRNRPVVVDGVTFDSAAEGDRYKTLRLLELGGQIRGLELQPRFVLAPAVKLDGKTKPAIRYVADFRYIDCHTGRVVVEDVKGMVTPIYRLKRHLMKSVHNIDIVEIRRER